MQLENGTLGEAVRDYLGCIDCGGKTHPLRGVPFPGWEPGLNKWRKIREQSSFHVYLLPDCGWFVCDQLFPLPTALTDLFTFCYPMNFSLPFPLSVSVAVMKHND